MQLFNHQLGHYSQGYFVHRQLKYAWHNKVHSLIGKPYLVKIASNVKFWLRIIVFTSMDDFKMIESMIIFEGGIIVHVANDWIPIPIALVMLIMISWRPPFFKLLERKFLWFLCLVFCLGILISAHRQSLPILRLLFLGIIWQLNHNKSRCQYKLIKSYSISHY